MRSLTVTYYTWYVLTVVFAILAS